MPSHASPWQCHAHALCMRPSHAVRAVARVARRRLEAQCPPRCHEGFDPSRMPEELWMEADAVVAESLAALDDSEADVVLVTGAQNRAMVSAALGRLARSVGE